MSHMRGVPDEQGELPLREALREGGRLSLEDGAGASTKKRLKSLL